MLENDTPKADIPPFKPATPAEIAAETTKAKSVASLSIGDWSASEFESAASSLESGVKNSLDGVVERFGKQSDLLVSDAETRLQALHDAVTRSKHGCNNPKVCWTGWSVVALGVVASVLFVLSL